MATLSDLVKEVDNIKNELVKQCANLKNNLVEKGVEPSEEDKLTDLVDKVKEIEQVVEVGISDKVFFDPCISYFWSSSATSYEKITEFLSTFKGSIRASMEIKKEGSGSGNKAVKFVIVRDGVEYNAKYINVTTTSEEIYECDLEGIRPKDKIVLYGKSVTSSYRINVVKPVFKGEIIG